MRKLTFAPAAKADLQAIGLFIAADNPDRALRFLVELETTAQLATDRPESFPSRNDISPGLRMIIHGRYLLFFRHSSDEIRMVRILHGARDIKTAFHE